MKNIYKIYKLSLFFLILILSQGSVDAATAGGNILILGSVYEADLLPLRLKEAGFKYTYIHNWDAPPKGDYSFQKKKLEHSLKEKNLKKFNIIVISGWSKADLSEKYQRPIIKWVKEGGSLICIGPSEFYKSELSKIFPLDSIRVGYGRVRKAKRENHPITCGFPLDFFKGMRWEILRGQVNGTRLLRNSPFGDLLLLRQVEKGKVIEIMFKPYRRFALAIAQGGWDKKGAGSLAEEEFHARFWYRLFNWLIHPEQYPFSLNVRLSNATPRWGDTVKAHIELLNWDAGQGKVILSVRLLNSGRKTVAEKRLEINVPPKGKITSTEVEFALQGDWTPGWWQIQVESKDLPWRPPQAFYYFKVAPELEISIDADKSFYDRNTDKEIKTTITFNKMDSSYKESTITVQLEDINGRILWRKKYKGEVWFGKNGLEENIPLDRCRRGVYDIRVNLVKGNHVYASAVKRISVFTPFNLKDELIFAPSFAPEDFPPYPKLLQRVFAKFKQDGMDGLYLQGLTSTSLRIAESYGLKVEGEISTRQVHPPNWPSVKLFEDNSELLSYLQGEAERNLHISPSLCLVSLTEEGGSIADRGGEVYYRRFVSWLKEDYENNLAIFNQVLGKRFPGWKEVGTFSWKRYFEKKEFADNPAPEYLLDEFEKWYVDHFFQLYGKMYKEMNPFVQTTISCWGNPPYNPSVKLDAWDFTNALGKPFNNHAGDYKYAVSGGKPGNAYMWVYEDGLVGGAYKYRPFFPSHFWIGLSSGTRYFAFWTAFYGPDLDDPNKELQNALYYSNLKDTAASKVLSAFLNKIIRRKGGIFKDNFPLFYKHLAVVNSQRAAMLLNQKGIYPQVIDLNYNDRARLKDVLSGARLCFFGNLEFLDQQTADIITNFIEKGGTAIFSVKGLPRYDYLGRKFSTASKFYSALGIEQIKGRDIVSGDLLEVRKGGIFEGLSNIKSPEGVGIIPLRDNMKLIAKYADGSPAILAHGFGRGKVFFLNFSWKSASPRFMETIVLNILGEQRICRVTAPAGVTQRILGNKDGIGGIKYLMLFNENYGGAKKIAKVEIMKKNVDVYDVIKGKKVSFSGKSFTVELPPLLTGMEGHIYALVPYPVSKMKLETSRSDFDLGSDVIIKISILGVNEKPVSGVHSVHLRVLNKAGEEIEAFTQDIAVHGEASIVLPTAFNDPAGIWEVRAEDITTGLSASVQLRAKRTGGS